MGNDSLAQQQYASKVYVNNSLPALRIDLEGLHRLGDAGIVDQDVNCTEFSGHGGHRAAARFGVGHVTAQTDVPFTQSARRLMCRIQVQIKDRDFGTMGRKEPRRGKTDPPAAGSARDHRCFAVQEQFILPSRAFSDRCWCARFHQVRAPDKRELYKY